MPGKLSTHVLDLTTGRPAAGLKIELWSTGPSASVVKSVLTNADGRTDQPLLSAETIAAGTFELVFHVASYFEGKPGVDPVPFLDRVPVRFTISDPDRPYHVPLLVTPWAYSTYRGS